MKNQFHELKLRFITHSYLILFVTIDSSSMSLASVARRIAARGTSVPIARAVDLVTIPRRHMAEAPKKGGAKPKKGK